MIYENIKLSPNSIVTYRVYPKKQRTINVNSTANLLQNSKSNYNGYMSKATSRKVKEMINVLILSLRFGSNGSRKPTFATFTLPSKQKHCDKEIKRKALDNILTISKRQWNVKNFVWRAEPQQNGNIHFHVLFDKFIEWKLIRGYWNRYMSKLGYIDDYRNNMMKFHENGFQVREDLLENWSLESQRKSYNYGIATNWTNPNSTDIHGLYKVNNIASYITKYMTKDTDVIEQLKYLNSSIKIETELLEKLKLEYELRKVKMKFRPIAGRIWGSTKAIKTLKNYTTELAIHDFDNSVYDPRLTDYFDRIERMAENITKENEHFRLIVHKKSQEELLRKNAPKLFIEYKNYYKGIYQDLYR